MFSKLRERAAQVYAGGSSSSEQAKDVNIAPAAEKDELKATSPVSSSTDLEGSNGTSNNHVASSEAVTSNGQQGMMAFLRSYASTAPAPAAATSASDKNDPSSNGRDVQNREDEEDDSIDDSTGHPCPLESLEHLEESESSAHVTNPLSTATGSQPAQAAPLDVLDDPEISRLSAEIHHLKAELETMKQSGRKTKRRRQQEVNTLKSHINSKGREMWFTQQKSKRFGLGNYKTEMLKCSLPAHDTSSNVLNAEAKLLRAQHNSAIADHQLTIVHEFQQQMIDYLYQKALPDIQTEQDLAKMVGKSQLEKLLQSQQRMVDMFEDCLGLQRKIIAKYKLRELEQSRHKASPQTNKTQLEAEKLTIQTEEKPAMVGEKSSTTPDSNSRHDAKQRLDQRLAMREERRRSRESANGETTEGEVEKTALQRAQEQIERLSNHSVDLNLDSSHGEISDKHLNDSSLHSSYRQTDHSRRTRDEEDVNDLTVNHEETDQGSEDAHLEDANKEETAVNVVEKEIPAKSDSERISNSVEDAPVQVTDLPNGEKSRGTFESNESSPVKRATSPSFSPRGSLRGRRSDNVPQDESLHSTTSVSEQNENEPMSAPAVSPKTPSRRATGRREPKGVASATAAGRSNRSDLLERARLARLQDRTPGTTGTTARARPTIGSRAVSSRDFDSSRRTAGVRAGAKSTLGESEHARRVVRSDNSDDQQNTGTNSAGGDSSDKAARMERLASRRPTAAASNRPKTTPGLSAERRAQLRNGLSSRRLVGKSS